MPLSWLQSQPISARRVGHTLSQTIWHFCHEGMLWGNVALNPLSLWQKQCNSLWIPKASLSTPRLLHKMQALLTLLQPWLWEKMAIGSLLGAKVSKILCYKHAIIPLLQRKLSSAKRWHLDSEHGQHPQCMPELWCKPWCFFLSLCFVDHKNMEKFRLEGMSGGLQSNLLLKARWAVKSEQTAQCLYNHIFRNL